MFLVNENNLVIASSTTIITTEDLYTIGNTNYFKDALTLVEMDFPPQYEVGFCEYFGGEFKAIAKVPELPPIDLLAAKVEKLAEISKACEVAITTGCDVETTEGNEHFSLTPNDQINLSANYTMVMQGATHALYHADSKLCRMFTADEITTVMTAATLHKTYHTTYCNHLNVWINRCENVAEILKITYGEALPDDLQSHMKEILGAVTDE